MHTCVARDPDALWTRADMNALRMQLEDSGLQLAAIENLDPAYWHDILLDGPLRAVQMEKVKTILRRILDILAKNGFGGVVIPDHTPQMGCPAPWHGGMAHTLGFMSAVLACQRRAAMTANA